jgi:hypothetical protein
VLFCSEKSIYKNASFGVELIIPPKILRISVEVWTSGLISIQDLLHLITIEEKWQV